MRFILDHLDPRARPIVTRLINVDAKPTLSVLLRLAVCLSLILLAIYLSYYVMAAIYINSASDLPQGPVYKGIGVWHSALNAQMFLAVGVLIGTPLIVAAQAAMLASHQRTSEDYRVLILTRVTEKTLFQSYFVTTLLRMRGPLILGAALTPIFAISLIRITFTIWQLARLEVWLRHLPAALAVAIGVWGLSLIGANYGASVGLGQADPLIAAIYAIGGTGALMAAEGIVIALIFGPFAVLGTGAIPADNAILTLLALILASVPLLITDHSMRWEGPLPESEQP